MALRAVLRPRLECARCGGRVVEDVDHMHSCLQCGRAPTREAVRAAGLDASAYPDDSSHRAKDNTRARRVL